MKVTITRKTKEESTIMKMEDVSDIYLLRMIQSLYGTKEGNEVVEFTLPPTTDKHSETPKKDYEPPKKLLVKEPEPAQPKLTKKLPRIGQEGRSSFQLGELLAAREVSVAVMNEETLPENTKLAEDGSLLFPVQITCSSCNAAVHRRLIQSSFNFVKCRACERKLKVEPATIEVEEYKGKKHPGMDRNGYYYTAKEVYEYPPTGEE